MKRPFLLSVIAGVVLSASLSWTVFAQNGPNVVAMQRALDAQKREAAIAAIAANKAQAAQDVVARWADSASRPFGGAWEGDVRLAVAAANPERIYDAQQAQSYQQFVDVLVNGASLTPRAPSGSTDGGPSALGDGATDLVYTPVTPCRIVDTRLAGGALAANTNRNFGVVDGYLAAQGGATSCGIPADPKGIVVTMVAAQPQGPGDLRAWPLNTTMPNASVLNYNSTAIANTMIIPISQLVGLDFTVRADVSATHVVIDIMGYFWSPQANEMDVTQVIATANVNAGSYLNSPLTATCPAGRTISGGGMDFSGIGTDVWIWENGPDRVNNRWNCRLGNYSSVMIGVECRALCARMPGR